MINQKDFSLIKEWTEKNRPQAEPDHQVERYAWLKKNAFGRLLSIGCGEAKVEEYLYIQDNGECDYSQPVCGADLNLDYLDSARTRWPNGQFVKYDICNDYLNFPNEEFDTVVLGDVIEHIPPYYIHKLISESIRVSKKNFNILITTPNGDYFGDNNASSIYSSDHVVVMSQTVLRNILTPPPDALKWWVRDGRASHRFNYACNMIMSASQRFLFTQLTCKGEM